MSIEFKVEFSGGMELLFNNERKHTFTITPKDESYVELQKKDSDKHSDPLRKDNVTLKDLIFYIRDTMMTDKKDLFVDKDTVRPGVLVLINDMDWELCDELSYKLQDKDEVVFISTLHGG